MDVLRLFRERGAHLVWRRLADDHVGGRDSVDILPEEAYLVIRLAEVYLARNRRLWRKFYPVVHAWSQTEANEENALVSPTQLQLGTANLDRVVTLNARMTGPSPYRGGDVALVTALYSVPGDDAARALVATLGALTALMPAAAPYVVAGIAVADGIDQLLGLSQSTLQLGVCDTFYQNNPLRSGSYVGMGADTQNVDFGRLWLRDGHLVEGANPAVARPFTSSDYFVVELERQIAREDWAGLPDIRNYEKEFATIMQGRGDVAEKRALLGRNWPQFTETLNNSSYLTRMHATWIAENVQRDLTGRLLALESGNPFDPRLFGEVVEEDLLSGEVVEEDPRDVDFAGIPDYITVDQINRDGPTAVAHP